MTRDDSTTHGRQSQTPPRRKRLLVFNDPRPLRVDRSLAQEIGFLESLVLLQIEYHISTTNNLRDGRYWTYQTLSDLRKNDFPWLSLSTISRTLKSLEDMGLLDTGNYNKVGYDRTTWYALNYEGISRLVSIGVGEDATPILQNENWELRKEKAISQNEKSALQDATPILQDETTIPEYSPKENTQKNTNKRAPAAPGEGVVVCSQDGGEQKEQVVVSLPERPTKDDLRAEVRRCGWRAVLAEAQGCYVEATKAGAPVLGMAGVEWLGLRNWVQTWGPRL